MKAIRCLNGHWYDSEIYDKCPHCGASVKTVRGIEVGHIFKLGTKYSKALECKFLDENGETSIGKSLVLGNTQKTTSYTLYDMQGKELRRFTARDFTEALNMARQNSQGFVSGIYLLKQSGKNTMVKKFWMH